MNPLLLVDNYKLDHFRMYPEGMTKLYSNFTPRKSRFKEINSVVVFGIQHFIKEYLIKEFNEKFFFTSDRDNKNKFTDNLNIKKGVLNEYKKYVKLDSYQHIEDLWDLGYLPIEIKALAEGTECPIGVPLLTITNTHPDFGWLVNYLETIISSQLWQPITSATIAREYKANIDKWSLKTTGTTDGNRWLGHDFSMRGMSSRETAIISGMGHLLSFDGTDVVPAIAQMEASYNAENLVEKGVGGVPATEHSVMCMGTKESEIKTFERLLDLYPTGILSVVSDTWDLWKVCTEFLPALKDKILARDGKLVIRPDSGDPADIICGNNRFERTTSKYTFEKFEKDKGFGDIGKKLFCESKGVIELLWDIFGGTINEQGYKVLDPHIGVIYGDGIGLHNLDEINSRLEAKGFATTNWVAGFGSYGYQYNTRDTFGFAMKATYGEIKTHCTCEEKQGKHFAENAGEMCCIEPREIFKDPITDDGTKKSKKGLLQVAKNPVSDEYIVLDQQSWKQESMGYLETVFKDGKLVNETSYDEIKERLNSK